MVPSARLAWLHPPRGDCVGLIHPVYLSGLGNGCVRVPRKTAWSGSSHHPCTPPPPNAGCREVHLRARPRGPGQRAPGCSLSDPFFSPMFRLLSAWSSSVSHMGGSCISQLVSRGTLPAPQRAGTLQLPRPSLTHRSRQHLSHQFLIHFPAKRMTGYGPETELPKGGRQEQMRAQAGQSFLLSPRSCSSSHFQPPSPSWKKVQHPPRGQAG